MSPRFAVAACGAVGLVVLARAGTYYARVDSLALALVLVMTVSLVGSIVELLLRLGRAEQLTRELRALPRPATAAAVESASDALRPLLVARAANASTPLPLGGGSPLAAYVVGLLVMLGLLGTFLGLFETLRGAREALSSSGDVEALRASLAAPMQGLTRSFGTSAAGVSASSMLGLAVALARRAEAGFGQAFNAYAAGALVPLTVHGRQLDALERLARHGDAMPRAVVALDGVVSRLDALQASWTEAHANAATQTSAALHGAVAGIRSDLEEAVARSGRAVEAVVAPLLERTVEGCVTAASGHVTAVAERLSADLDARRTADLARARADEEALARATVREDARAEALAARWTETTRTLETALAAIERRSEVRDAAFGRTGAELAAAARATMDAARERLDEASARAVAGGEQLGAIAVVVGEQTRVVALAAEEQRGALGTLFAGIGARAQALDADLRAGHAELIVEVQRGAAEHAARAATLEREMTAALTLHAERVVAALSRHSEELEARLETMAGALRDAAAGVQAGGGELVAVAEMFAGAVDRHREGAAEWLVGLGTVEGAIARAADGSAGVALAEQLDRARELYDAQLHFHRELLLQLRGVELAAGARDERRDDRDRRAKRDTPDESDARRGEEPVAQAEQDAPA